MSRYTGGGGYLPLTWWLGGSQIDLFFQQGKYFDAAIGDGQAVTNYVSCSRASTGYAKNANGTLTSFASNGLRIGVGTGLLVEGADTNIVPNSNTLSDMGTTNISVTTNATTAPDGTNTASKEVPSATNAIHTLGQFYTTTAGVFTVSAFFKAAEYNYGYIRLGNNADTLHYGALFDLTTGNTITTRTLGSPTGTANGSELYGNGWVRVWLSMTMAAEASTLNISLSSTSSPSFSGDIPVFLGDGTSGVYLWGVQWEAGTFMSSQIQTSGASATRAADNVTIIGNALTDIGTGTASIVAQVNSQGTAGVATNVVDSNGTNLLGYNSSNNALASLVATLATSNTGNRTTRDKLGIGWDPSGRNLVINAGTAATDASAQTPSAVTQHLGSSGSANFLNGYSERLTVWTSKLSVVSLQSFTT